MTIKPIEEKQRWVIEYLLCADSLIGFLYFIETYCKVLDGGSNEWVPFKLWKGQRKALVKIHRNDKIIILKARQIGLTWLLVAYALWTMIFIPNSIVLFWSKRDDEATELIENRLYPMWQKLPPQLQPKLLVKNAHEMILVNGSRAQAFPTTAGDSYRATLAVLDEFDLVDNQQELLGMVEPTVGDTGKLVIISRVNKKTPQSAFKKIWANAMNFTKIFLSWNERPDRDAKWYEAKVQDSLDKTGSMDAVYEQYPSTPEEALAPLVQDKAIPTNWLMRNYSPMVPLDPETLTSIPAINGLRVYKMPIPGRRYVMGVDTAEGNVNSDDSAINVIDVEYKEEVAVLQGKFTPAVLGGHIYSIARFFNHADALVENNNHGHAVILYVENLDGRRVNLLKGHDGKIGWTNNAKGKSLMYASGIEMFRSGEHTLHDGPTFTQLSTIEGATLSAPAQMFDDLAVAKMLALQATKLKASTWQAAASAKDKMQDRDKIMEKRLRTRRQTK